MASTKVEITVTLNGLLTDPTSLKWGESGDSYGVRRMPDKTSYIIAETAITNVGTGRYDETWVDATAGSHYDYIIGMVYSGTTYRFYQNKSVDRTIRHRISLPSTTYYSSEAEVMRLLSPYAVNLHMEDQHDTSSAWTEVLADVNATMDMYLTQRYPAASLTNVQWVRRNATYLAASELSTRRGNPSVFNNRVARVYEELDAIRKDLLHLPIAPIGFGGPVVRNYTLQNFYRGFPQRVQSLKSTGDSYSGEVIALQPYLW